MMNDQTNSTESGDSSGPTAQAAENNDVVVDPNAWTVKRIMEWSTDFLKTHGMNETPRLDVELLLTEVLGLTRIQLYTSYGRLMSDEERSDFKKLLLRRKESEPVAYILGRRDFFKYTFKVTSDVLIPRSDTEILVETAISELKSGDVSPVRIIDLGSGTGCITICVAKEFPESEVVGVDICPESIELAKTNAVDNSANNASFVLGDALSLAFWENLSEKSAGKFDMIMSNPPYIAESEKESISDSVIKYEPHQALFAENDGLIFYQVISKNAPKILNAGGKLIVEVGYLQSLEVAKIFEEDGYSDVEVIKDFSGHGRVVKATL